MQKETMKKTGQVVPETLNRRMQLLSLGLEKLQQVLGLSSPTQSGNMTGYRMTSIPETRRNTDFSMNRNLLLDCVFANFPDIVDGYERSEVVVLDCRALRTHKTDGWNITRAIMR